MSFPSPAADYLDLKLDLNQELVDNPPATFFVRATRPHPELKVSPDDIIVVDKSISPRKGHLAVCFSDGVFKVQRIDKQDSEYVVWGVVTYIIHKV
ncbi:MAG: peptidase S24 [Bacteroidota bacterium]|nr:peptidase S24 [Bacteroidota bacterium]